MGGSRTDLENSGKSDVLALCACFKARSAARAVTALYDESLETTGLKITQFATLSVIRSRGTVSMQRLAEELGLDPSTMSRTLRLLQARELVQSGNGADRRIRELSLTRSGEKVFLECQKRWTRAQSRLRERLGEDTFVRVLADLETVADRLNAFDDNLDKIQQNPSN